MGLDQIPNSAPPEPLKARYDLNDPMVQILGKYDDFRKKLVEDRKREFKKYMEQVATYWRTTNNLYVIMS